MGRFSRKGIVSFTGILFAATRAAFILAPEAHGFSIQTSSWNNCRSSLFHPRPNKQQSARSLQSASRNARSRSSSSSTARAAFVDVPSVLSSVSIFYKTAPYISGFITCGIKAAAADIVAQTSETKKQEEELESRARSPRFRGRFYVGKWGAITLRSQKSAPRFDVLRSLSFLLYGGFYQGMAQAYVINTLFPIWFGNGKTIGSIISKVMFDMLVLAPFVTIPVCYITKALIFRKSIDQGLRSYWQDIRHNALLIKFWSLWFPVQCLTFSVIPEHLRVTFIACVSFFWMIVFSSLSASSARSN